MKILQGIELLRETFQGRLFLALGNFDGVHLGHRAIIRATVDTANHNGGKSAVLIFTPHPLSILAPSRYPALLLTMEDRIAMLGEAGVDFVVVHPFTREFAAMSPEMFTRDILRDTLRVSGIVVGFDYSFGHLGSGKALDLKKYGSLWDFSAQIIDPVEVNSVPVGSTKIRMLLADGLLEEAAAMLGYPFFLRGSVVHGDGRGRKLGFPTANVLTPCDVIQPAHGVYLTLVEMGNKQYWALTNVGRRPTFCKKECSVEVHLLDLHKNIYGQELKVHFLRKIREEKQFTGSAELTEQIKMDIDFARELIARYGEQQL